MRRGGHSRVSSPRIRHPPAVRTWLGHSSSIMYTFVASSKKDSKPTMLRCDTERWMRISVSNCGVGQGDCSCCGCAVPGATRPVYRAGCAAPGALHELVPPTPRITSAECSHHTPCPPSLAHLGLGTLPVQRLLVHDLAREHLVALHVRELEAPREAALPQEPPACVPPHEHATVRI